MSSSTLLFSKPLLNKIYYHWLWGLGYGERTDLPSFGKLLFASGNTEEFIGSIRTRQNEIQQYNPVKHFYWLFNIENYRRNKYLIFSYDSYEEYRKHYLEEEEDRAVYIEKPASNSAEKDDIADYFRHKLNSWRNRYYLELIKEYFVIRRDVPPNNYNNPLPNNNVSPNRYCAPDNAIPRDLPVPNDDKDKSLIVSSDIQETLSYMGISKENGEALLWHEVCIAYKKQALKFHPDKPKGSNDAWLRLMSCKEILEGKFFPEKRASGAGVTQRDVFDVLRRAKNAESLARQLREDFLEDMHQLRSQIRERCQEVNRRAANAEIRAANAEIRAANAESIAANAEIKAANAESIAANAERISEECRQMFEVLIKERYINQSNRTNQAETINQSAGLTTFGVFSVYPSAANTEAPIVEEANIEVQSNLRNTS